MRIVNLEKSYGEHTVLEGLSLTFEEGKIYALMGASGCGKTTLLHLLLGLLSPDGGSLEGFSDKRFSAVFQENRLCEFLTAAENAAVVGGAEGNVDRIDKVLAEILPEESLAQPVSAYSGGMKRRAAIGRALLAKSDILIMDEPLTGLDEGTREQVIRFILRHREGRTLIFSTHQEEDVEAFGAEKIMLYPARKKD